MAVWNLDSVKKNCSRCGVEFIDTVSKKYPKGYKSMCYRCYKEDKENSARAKTISGKIENYGGCLYIAFDPHTLLFKIGQSKNPDQRLKVFQLSNPDLDWLIVFPYETGHNPELELHKHFASKRIRREWFALNYDDIYYAASEYMGYFITPEALMDWKENFQNLDSEREKMNSGH